jgi:hypothetical protein
MIKKRRQSWLLLLILLTVLIIWGSNSFVSSKDSEPNPKGRDGSVSDQATSPTALGSSSKTETPSLQEAGATAPDVFTSGDSAKPESSSELPGSSSPILNSSGKPTGVNDSKNSSTVSTTTIVPITCQVYVNPIGQPANRSFRLIVTSSFNFTASVSITWSKKTESLTLDVVNGSASAIIKGDQLVQPKVSVTSQSDTATELCTNRNS